MNSALSSLRILPAGTEAAALKSAGEGLNPGSGDGTSPFLDVLHGALDDMQQLQGEAQSKVAGVLEGNGTDVHSALIAVEKADLSFQLMMQVRNKIVSAYQEISRMQF